MIPGLAGTPGFDEDDEEQKRLKGIGGSIGDQMGAPVMPAAPPPMPPQSGPGIGEGVLPPDAADLPAPPPAAPPPVAPYQPAPLPPIPASRTVTAAEAANLGAMDANMSARMGTAQQAGDVARQQAVAKAVEADANAGTTHDYLAQREEIEARAQKDIVARQQKAAQDFQAYREFGIKDPEADQSIGHRILAGIAVGLGAYAQGIQGGQNNALTIIQKANADNIAEQKAKQEKLFRLAERSGEDVEAARKERDDAFHQLDLKHAALLQGSADELKANLARIGIPAEQIATNGDVQKLEHESLQMREANLRKIAGDETQLARADITAAAKRAKAAAAGGGGSSGGMAELIKMKEDGESDSAIAKRASELKVPIGGKQGWLQAVREVRVGSNQGRAGDARDEKATASEADKWAKGAGLDKIQGQQRELLALQKELQDNANNPLQQALAVEKAVSAARGGAASKQALALALEHLGGSIDKPEAFIAKVRDGQLGAKQLDNFKSFLNGQLGASQAEGKRAYDNYTAMAEAETDPAKKARLIRDRTRLFSSLSGFGGRSESMSAPTPAAQPQRKEMSAGQKAEALQWARANREDPRAKRILQALGE